MPRKYDHIIVGTGQSTGTLLGRLMPTGESIAVIEGNKVGGSCVNYGCTPTKALVASAKAIYQTRRGKEFGFGSGEIRLNFDRVRERMNTIRGNSSRGLTEWMESAENVDLIQGWAAFASDHTIKINDDEIIGDKIYINTGTRPAVPTIQGLDDVPWLDSAMLLDLEKLPEHLLIIGGGYIGVEFAQIYRRFGSGVTLLQRSSRIMPGEDQDISEEIRKFLEDEGVDVLCDTSVSSVSHKDDTMSLEIDRGGNNQHVSGSHLLVATGRLPNSDRLSLEKTGIKLDEHRYIRVNDHCETDVKDVFAVGDVNGHGAFTHTSVNDAEIVLDYLYGGNRKISSRIPIYALFTDPPLGRVGMTEEEAIVNGYQVSKAVKPMNEISRAKEMSETKGFAKVLVDAKNDQLLGASVLGAGGDEVIGMFATMMHAKMTCRKFREIVLIHPTISELMPWIFDELEPLE